MKNIQAKIIENKKIADGFYRMRLASPYLARNSKPGQFVEVRCSDEYEPLLRRPLGIHMISKSGISLLYEVVGEGTAILSKKKPGEFLDIIGPLGNGFTLPRVTSHGSRATILIAGGVGVAPLVALAEQLSKAKIQTHAIIGATTKTHVLCGDEFRALGCSVKIATEDGSKGTNGLATDLLQEYLRATSDPSTSLGAGKSRATIYACGPLCMLKAVAAIAGAKHINCQISLEERMACGIGVCLGCPVKVLEFSSSRVRSAKLTNSRTHELTNYTYKMVCKDGPVFDAKEITW